jgi:hypothetical protein
MNTATPSRGLECRGLLTAAARGGCVQLHRVDGCSATNAGHLRGDASAQNDRRQAHPAPSSYMIQTAAIAVWRLRHTSRATRCGGWPPDQGSLSAATRSKRDALMTLTQNLTMQLVLDDNVVRSLGHHEIKVENFVTLRDEGVTVHIADEAMGELAHQLLERRFPWQNWLVARDALHRFLDTAEPVLLGGRQGLYRAGIRGATDEVSPSEISSAVDYTSKWWANFMLVENITDITVAVKVGSNFARALARSQRARSRSPQGRMDEELRYPTNRERGVGGRSATAAAGRRRPRTSRSRREPHWQRSRRKDSWCVRGARIDQARRNDPGLCPTAVDQHATA